MATNQVGPGVSVTDGTVKSAPVNPFSFQTTPSGTVQVSQAGKIISTTTPSAATTLYGYNAGGTGTTQPSVNQNTISGSASIPLATSVTQAATAAANTVGTPPGATTPTTTPGGTAAPAANSSQFSFTQGSTLGNYQVSTGSGTTTIGGNATPNLQITDPATGKVLLTAPQGTQLDPGVQASLQNVSQVLSGMPQGYSATVNTDGSVNLVGPNGTLSTIPAAQAADGSTLDSLMGTVGALDSTIQAANTNQTAQQQELTTQYNQQLQELEQQRQAALTAATATFGGEDASTSTADNSYTQAINLQFNQQKQSLTDSYNSATSTLANGTAQSIATAQGQFATAASTAVSNAQSQANNQQNFAKQNFESNLANTDLSGVDPTQYGLPSGTSIQSMTTAQAQQIPAYAALIQQGMGTGLTSDQAWGLVQAGQEKIQKTAIANAQTLLSQIPFGITQGMTTQQIMSSYGNVVTALQNAGYSQAQAIQAVQNGSISQQKEDVTVTGSETGIAPTDSTTTVTASPPDPATGDQVGIGIAANTKYTPNAIYQDAIEYAFTGKVPSLGLGTAAQVQNARAQINNIAASIVASSGQNFPTLQSLYKSNSAAATQSVERLARVTSVLNSTTANFPRLETLADSLKTSGITITESDIQAGSAAVQEKFGNPDAASYVELINTMRSDYSAAQAALAGGRGGQYFAESAAQAIPSGLSSQQYAAIQNTINLSSTNAIKATNDEVNNLLTISNITVGSDTTDSTDTTDDNSDPTSYTTPTGTTYVLGDSSQGQDPTLYYPQSQ